MTYDVWKATDSADEWLGPDPVERDEEPDQFDSAGAPDASLTQAFVAKVVAEVVE